MILFFKAIINLFRLVFLAVFCALLYPVFKKRSIYHFLNFAGPSFIKLGQTLATRPDIVGDHMAEILSKFQDKVKPFSAKKVKKALKKDLEIEFEKTFSEFDYHSKASASIAQVHKAKLISGEEVAVKILRPNIKKITKRDIATLKIIVKITRLFSKSLAKTLLDIEKLLEEAAKTELNLMREASMAIRLRQEMQAENVKGFYVPKIYAKYSSQNILVSEWLYGIKFSDKKAILNSNFDKKQIAENFIIAYFTQVYQNGFFHADMHQGNLFLLENGDIGVVDFGIMCEIDKKLRIAIAEILIAYINKDYEKVAKIHIDAEIVPKDANLYELTLSCKKIGERMVGNSIKEISWGHLLKELIDMAKNYKMSTKPELLLLQKTILLVEGTGIMLDPDLNIWKIAKPWVKDWVRKNIGFDAKIRDIAVDIIDAIKKIVKDNL